MICLFLALNISFSMFTTPRFVLSINDTHQVGPGHTLLIYLLLLSVGYNSSTLSPSLPFCAPCDPFYCWGFPWLIGILISSFSVQCFFHVSVALLSAIFRSCYIFLFRNIPYYINCSAVVLNLVLCPLCVLAHAACALFDFFWIICLRFHLDVAIRSHYCGISNS